MSALPAPPRLDEGGLRAAFGRFATGVAFVTADVDDRPLGLIVSSFTAVSLHPPLVSFCPSRTSLTWQHMRHARRFTIHVLAAQHATFARRAAPPGAHRFSEPLREPLAVIECDLTAAHAAGDHWIVIGHVRHIQTADGNPLVYYAGRFGAFHAIETKI